MKFKVKPPGPGDIRKPVGRQGVGVAFVKQVLEPMKVGESLKVEYDGITPLKSLADYTYNYGYSSDKAFQVQRRKADDFIIVTRIR